MADYYVSPAGDNSDGSTWAKAYTTIAAALTAAGVGPDTIELDGGIASQTYTENIDINNVNITLKGSSEIGHNGIAIIDGSGNVDHGIDIKAGKTGCTIQNLKIIGVPATKSAIYDSGGSIITDVWLDSNYRGVTANAVTTTITKSLLTNTANIPLLAEAVNSSINASYNVIIGGSRISVHNNSTIYMYNNTIVGLTLEGFLNAGTGEAKITNNIFSACCLDAGNYVIDQDGAGTVTASNNLINRNLYQSTTTFLSPTATDGGGNLYAAARFQNPYRKGIVCIIVDDYAAATETYAVDLQNLAKSYGFNITWAINNWDYSGSVAAINWLLVQGFVNSGGDVVTHSYHHVDLKELETIRIQNTNGACSLTIDIGAGTLTTLGDSQFVMDLTDTATYDHNANGFVDMEDIVFYINALANYTCTLKSAYSSYVEWSSLSDVAGQDINTGVYQCLLNPARFYTNEITASITEIESNLTGVNITGIVYPYNYYDDTLIANIKNLVNGARAAATGTNYKMTAGLNVYKIRGDNASSVITATNVARNAGSFADTMNASGGVACIYSHSPAEYSLSNWAIVFEAIKNSNVTVMTLSDAISYVRTNGTTADDITYTVALTTNNIMTLKSNSLCRDAGVVIAGLTTDFEGKPVPMGSAPDIGAYEWVGGGGGLSPGLGLSGGNRPPWWHRIR